MSVPALDRTSLVRLAASWAVAFPTITVLLALLDPVMTGWPLIARTFLLVTLMVPIMSVATPALLARLADDNQTPSAKRLKDTTCSNR